eukprot:COSAG01_NODE_10344_length_2187_cov_6.776927_1_plen_194_part_00
MPPRRRSGCAGDRSYRRRLAESPSQPVVTGAARVRAGRAQGGGGVRVGQQRADDAGARDQAQAALARPRRRAPAAAGAARGRGEGSGSEGGREGGREGREGRREGEVRDQGAREGGREGREGARAAATAACGATPPHTIILRHHIYYLSTGVLQAAGVWIPVWPSYPYPHDHRRPGPGRINNVAADSHSSLLG